MVFVILWSTIIVVTAFITAVMLVLPGSVQRALVIISSVDVLCLALLIVNERGHPRLAGLGLIAGLTTVVTGLSVTAGGMHAPATTVFVLVVLIAGLLLGERAGIITGIVCFSIGFGLVLAEARGVLPSPMIQHTAVSLWLINGLCIGMVIFLQRLATGAVQDALHKAEQELGERQRGEQRLRLALDAGGIGFWEENLETKKFVADERLFSLYGIPVTSDRTVSRQVWEDRVHPRDLAKQRSILERLSAEPGQVQTEFRVVDPAGNLRYVHASAATVTDERGRPISIAGTNIDITAAKLAQKEREELVGQLKERVKELRLLHATARLLQADRPFDRDLLMELLTLIPPAWQHPECCEARIAYGGIEVATPGWQVTPWKQSESFGPSDQRGVIEVVYTEECKPQAEGPFLAEERALLASMTEMLSVYLDHRRATDEQRRLESQLRQSQKMEALGTLSGGLAHDFNNILTAIAANSELALGDLPEGHPAVQSVQEISRAGGRAADLVRRMLVFSRRKEVDLKIIHLEPVLEEVRGLLRASLPAMVRVGATYAPDLPPVLADATQVHQVVMNLGINAGHAMSASGGALSISLDQITLDQNAARSINLLPGQHLRITVSDTGCGMSKEILERIFEPFFTTKGPESGTGLGLSVVHGIVKAHDGAIAVQSVVGDGTTFRIFFPAAEPVADSAQPVAMEVTRGRGQRLMYVDDEEVLVSVMERMLRRMGYSVTGYVDPHLALQAFRQDPYGYDAVITDMAMPLMTGRALADALRAVRPDIPIAMTSGAGERSYDDSTSAPGIGQAVISKPWSTEELGTAVSLLVRPVPGKHAGGKSK